MQFNKKYFLIALIHWGITTTFFDKFFFITSFYLKPHFWLIKFILLILFWQIIAYSINRYKNDPQFRLQINYALIYFLFSFFILLLIWPGSWFWDELEILSQLRKFTFSSWQHVLTSIYYLCGLFIFPSPVFIVILQILCISLIVGYFVYTVRIMTNNSKSAWLAYAPFLLIPVIHQNYSTYRATLFSYLILLFLLITLFQWQQKKTVTNKLTIYLAIIATMMTSWRGEGIYFIVLAPLLYMSAYWNTSSFQQKLLFMLSFCIGVSSINWIQKENWENQNVFLANQLTTYTSPLAVLIKQAQEDGRVDLLTDVDEVLNINVFSEYPNGRDAFWSHQLIRPQYYEIGSKKLIRAYLKLIKTYPATFLEERWRTFNYTNKKLMQSDNAIFLGAFNEKAAPIFKAELLSDYINPAMRSSALRFLALDSFPSIQKIIYHPAVPLFLLLLLTLNFLMKRFFILALASGAVLPAAFLAILSMPDSFFMYFFSSYLVGYSLFIASVIIWLVQKSQKFTELPQK